MPGTPQGITGLQGFVNSRPEAPPWEVQGGPADPAHANLGEQGEPYPWEAYGGAWGTFKGPLGIENELLADDPGIANTFVGGFKSQDPQGDLTPYRTHAAPWPKGLQFGEMSSASPAGTAEKLVQSADIHASDTNASENFNYDQTMWALQDKWIGFFNPVQGEDLLAAAGSDGQISPAAFGFGVNDHTSNEYHKANEYELNTSHRHRRYAAGSVPGNYMWMKPGGRPMIKSLPGPARPAVGPNSPFAGDDTFAPFGIDGAILQSVPTEYVSPPTPNVAPALQNFNEPSPSVDLW